MECPAECLWLHSLAPVQLFPRISFLVDVLLGIYLLPDLGTEALKFHDAPPLRMLNPLAKFFRQRLQQPQLVRHLEKMTSTS